MLAMAEGSLANDDLFWPDDGEESWPWSTGDVDGRGKKVVEIVGGGDQGDDKEEEQKVAAADKDPEEAPPESSKGKKRPATMKKGGGGGKGGKAKKDGGGGDSDHELHIWTERERRKKMKNMFQGLLDLLPHVSSKADKSTIVEEGVKYIKELQITLVNLEKQKLERIHGVPSREAFLADQISASNSPNPLFSGPTVFKTWTSPNVIVNISGRDAQICVCGPKKPKLFTGICFVLEKYRLDVVSAQISSDRHRCMYMIHTNMNGGSDPLLSSVFPVEEMYKQVAAEIMFWVGSS